MKDKIKSIISRMVFLGITGALLMGSTSSCNKDKHHKPNTVAVAAAPPTKNDYNPNDLEKMQKFFKQPSEKPNKTNGDIFKDNDPDFDADKPWTYNNGRTGEFTGGLTIQFNKASNNKRLELVDLTNSNFSGNLDLTGCDNLVKIRLTG